MNQARILLKYGCVALRRCCLFFAASVLLAVPVWAGLPLQQWKTSNGAKVMFVGTSAIPMIDISVEFDAGSRLDPAGKSGLAAL